jgi:anti-sigma factor RsiW
MHRRCGDSREALAVYVLGAIEPADRDVLDRHLAGCADCREELASLAGLPALLRRVSVEEATALAAGDAGVGPGDYLPSGPVLHSMLARSSRQRRRRARTRAAAAAAAGLVAGAGAIAVWHGLRAGGHPPQWSGGDRGSWTYQHRPG